MPLTVKDGALLGAGMWCVAGAFIFYKRKQTLPFKVAYFLSWPVLGTAVIKVFGPSDEKIQQELRRDGVSEAELAERRRLVQAQLDQLRSAAREGKE